VGVCERMSYNFVVSIIIVVLLINNFRVWMNYNQLKREVRILIKELEEKE
jgi:hypothetical protein